MKGFGTLKRLPDYFYHLDAVIPSEGGRRRWIDDFADEAPSIIQWKDMNEGYNKAKSRRNVAYSKWLASFFHTTPAGTHIPMLKGKQMRFQAIQILELKHSEMTGKEWWDPFRDAVLRAFVQPETVYDRQTGEHKQWYLICPEDCYLINKWEIEQTNPGQLAPRDYAGREKYLSADPRLRKARLVPVEASRHWRHETEAGKLDPLL